MKTILTTIFAIAVMVFAFNANPVMAGGGGSGLFGWITGESQVTEVEVASWDDDEKADQYGNEWFKVDDNGNIEVAYGCKMNSDGSVHCPGDAWNSENDESKVAWDTEPGGEQYCWQTVGKNGQETKCVPAAWKEQYDQKKESEIATYWEHCARSGNCMMKEDLPENTETAWVCWENICTEPFNEDEESDKGTEVAIDSTSPDDDWSEYIKQQEWFNSGNDESEIAYGASCTTDWNTGEQVCCTAYSGGGMFCYYPNATESKGVEIACSGRDAMYGCSSSAGQTFAGMTMDEKVKQDEDDWNNYILQQMFAGIADYCRQYGNCMMNEDGDSINQGEGTEQRDFASDRSGPTSTFSASDGDNASLVGDSHETIDAVDTENERVLESGNY